MQSKLLAGGFLLLLLFALIAAPAVLALSSGRVGYSGNPDPAHGAGLTCSVCHNGGLTPDVSISGPTTVVAGHTYLYSLIIAGGQALDPNAPAPAGGFNVSTTAGALLSLADDTRIESEEITHTQPKPIDANDEVIFTFGWTAPLTPTDTILYGSGNSVNGDFTFFGDAAATDALTLTVVPSDSASIVLTATVSVAADTCGDANNLLIPFGEPVYLCYTVANTGPVTLSLHTLEDSRLGLIFEDTLYDLAPGATVNTLELGLTLSDQPEVSSTYFATWTASEVTGASAVASAVATVEVEQPTDVVLTALGGRATPPTWPGVLLGLTLAGLALHLGRRARHTR